MEHGVGGELRDLREARGLSLGESARRAGVSRATLQHWEAGRHLPGVAALERLLDALEAGPRRRARLLHAADPRRARLVLAHSDLGASIDVGLVVRAMRARRRLTQADLARRAGVTQGTVAKWESGALEPSAETVHALGFALGASAEETLALAAAQGGVGPLGPDVGPEEGFDRICHAFGTTPHSVFEVTALAYEAEVWRRATRDPRWDAALCRAVSARATYDYHAGASGLGAPHAHRALRLARTVQARRATLWAVDVLTDIAKHRREDPAEAAALVSAWSEPLPLGRERAWADWVHAMRLAALGHPKAALAKAEGVLDPSFQADARAWAEHRIGVLVPVHLAGGDGRAAREVLDEAPLEANLHYRIEAYHACGESAPDGWLESVREHRARREFIAWHEDEHWRRIERRQIRLRRR